MTDSTGEAVAIVYPTSFGEGWLAFAGEGLIELGLPGAASPYPLSRKAPDWITQLAAGLTGYWRGGELPAVADTLLQSVGRTPLTDAIYRRVAAIPAGRTMTYGEVAAAVGRPRAARAVGAAMAANHFAPLIPCHRLVGSDGSLRGYAGGLDMKRYLIAMEAALVHG